MEEKGFVGELRVLQKLNEYEFGIEVWAIRDGINRNRWDYQNIEQHYKSFVGVPLLIAYRNGAMSPKDVGDGHNMTKRRDPKTGDIYYSFTDATSERIIGTISDDPNDVRLEEKDGATWVVAKGRIFRFYARELVDKIIETGTMEVSAETEVFESRTEDTGIEVFLDWKAIGITLLGDGVAPAVPGARIAALEAMKDDFEELKLRAASLREQPGVEPTENKLTKEVKNRMNFNNTQIAALADKFVGWIVVCAAKHEDGIHVGLMNEKGEFGTYVMNSETDTFAPERVEKCSVAVNFGDELSCDVEVLTTPLVAENATNANKIETLTNQLNDANETIRTLRENESARRVADAKRTAAETLAEFNANRAEKIEASVLDAVNADIDSGLYTNSVDKDGAWSGASEVAKTVKALCADAVLAQDKANAERSRRSFIWEENRDNSANDADDGSLASTLRRLNIE